MIKKDIVVGLGEIGRPILNIISKTNLAVGYDINPKLVDKKFHKYENSKTRFIHICIPYTDTFLNNVIELYEKFHPSAIVIHSTIKVNTTKILQSKLPIPVIYSATRGVHKRMFYDLKRYTKFFALDPSAPKMKWASSEYSKLMKSSGVKVKQISTPITLELAKILCDTSYLGWLINYAQITNMIAQEYDVNYDEMWSFADEIHEYLGNRPKMFPGYIGGHCVIPNLELIHNQTLNLIKEMNDLYGKKVKNAKKIALKYGAKLDR